MLRIIELYIAKRQWLTLLRSRIRYENVFRQIESGKESALCLVLGRICDGLVLPLFLPVYDTKGFAHIVPTERNFLHESAGSG